MKDSAAKGTAGILATAGGITISHATINEWLQTISLMVGIAVGIASLVSIWWKSKTKPNKMKNKSFLIVAALAVFSILPTFAQATNRDSTVAAVTGPAVTDQAPAAPADFTPADIAKLDSGVNNLLPFIPAAERPLALKVIGILGTLAMLGRIVVGWRTNGVFGVFTGLFGGTNTPKAPSPADSTPRFTTPRASGLGLLICFGVAALLFTGCAGDRQYVDNESGTGLKAKIPVGYNGNNIFEIDMTVGTFKHTTMIQPVMTNRVFTPTLVVAASTRGKFVANAMNSSTNATASTQGGDAYIINTGHAAASETNDTDLVTQAWQDAPPSQAGK
ncbi:MAG TPA: hypothetical protein VG347_01530 [Verrucomicrobiae bacterium]|nr:hypothetical protein [Verrucomicrobiae bacterium]